MSLINDALKRAKQTEGKPRPDRSVGVRLVPAESRGRGATFPVWLVPLLIVAVLLVSSWFFTQWWRQRPSSVGSGAANPAAPAQVPVAGVGVGATVPAVQVPAEVRPAVAGPVAGGSGGTAGAVGAGVSAGAQSEKSRAAGLVRVNTNLVVRTNPVKEVAAVEAAPVPAPEVRAVASVPGAGGTTVVATGGPEPVVAPVVGVKWPELKVQAIFYRRTNPSALINGETLEEGESILGAKVVRIDRQTVVLEMKGQTNTLGMGRR